MKQKPKKVVKIQQDEPTERQLKASERYARQIEKRWQKDLEEIRKTLFVDDYDD